MTDKKTPNPANVPEAPKPEGHIDVKIGASFEHEIRVAEVWGLIIAWSSSWVRLKDGITEEEKQRALDVINNHDPSKPSPVAYREKRQSVFAAELPVGEQNDAVMKHFESLIQKGEYVHPELETVVEHWRTIKEQNPKGE